MKDLRTMTRIAEPKADVDAQRIGKAYEKPKIEKKKWSGNVSKKMCNWAPFHDVVQASSTDRNCQELEKSLTTYKKKYSAHMNKMCTLETSDEENEEVTDELPNFAAFGLWGDAGQFTKKHNLFLLHFTMLTGIFRERFAIAGFSKHLLCQCGCFGRCTFDFVFSVIAWSYEALLIGRFPRKDHNGLEFHPCIRKFGDWSWYKQVLGLRGWRGETAEKKCCWMCGAGFNDMFNCYDFSLNAMWRRTVLSQADPEF